MIAKIILAPPKIAAINIGARILQVIPLTIITPAITAQITSVVPRSFCNKINSIGNIETPIIFKNSIKSDWNDLLKVNWLCLETVLARAKIKIIFINSEGWILIGPKLYQLFAPLITGVMAVSGKISNPMSKTQKWNIRDMYYV